MVIGSRETFRDPTWSMGSMEKKKRISFRIILIMILILGGSAMLLYPMISYKVSSQKQTQTVRAYSEAVERYTEEDYAEFRRKAEEYNASLIGKENPFLLTEEEEAWYASLLDLDGTGIMGYVEIPRIGELLPIYHGCSGTVLEEAAGHVPWSALPVGGESTHCVIPGHRGSAASKLFTDLDDMQIGDEFYLHVLDETLVYCVDQILVTNPGDPNPLRIVDGEDYCTLYTCTPFGINTQRLLVRGHRLNDA